jgi:hypothetical protein
MQEQIERDLDAMDPMRSQDTSAETPVISEGMLQADVSPAVKEDAQPVHGAQIQKADAVKAKSRKLRRQASETVEQTVSSEPMSEPASSPETDAVNPLPMMTLRKLDHRRLTKRQAASAQLPRHERWKQRLHPACW